jgi:hypothetical protein
MNKLIRDRADYIPLRVGKAEYLPGKANPRFIVTSPPPDIWSVQVLYEQFYCARGEMENRIKECQLHLFADRTSSATMRANQLRLWFASFAYVMLEALRRLGLHGTELADATHESLRLKLLKIVHWCASVRVGFTSAWPAAIPIKPGGVCHRRHWPRPDPHHLHILPIALCHEDTPCPPGTNPWVKPRLKDARLPANRSKPRFSTNTETVGPDRSKYHKKHLRHGLVSEGVRNAG